MRRSRLRCRRPTRRRPTLKSDSADAANIPDAGCQGQGHLRKGRHRAIGGRKAGRESRSRNPREICRRCGGNRGCVRRPAAAPPAPREKAVAKAAPVCPRRSLLHQIPPRRLRPRPLRKSTATPTISPVRRSSACAERARRAARRKRLARSATPRCRHRPCCPGCFPHSRASAPPVRPLPPPIMVSAPAAETLDSTTGSVPAKQPYAILPVRRRRPIFRSRCRSICMPMPRSRRHVNAPTWPRTCCWRRSRCFMPCCRSAGKITRIIRTNRPAEIAQNVS